MTKPASEALAVRYEGNILADRCLGGYPSFDGGLSPFFKQRTIKRPIKGVGTGRYGGEPVVMVLRPAPIGAGIVFRRVDIQPLTEVAVNIKAVQANTFQTSIVKSGIVIHGVEHLLSALAGLGIDNLYVDVDGMELPRMDDSAEPFVFLIRSAGIKQQSAAKRFIRVKRRTKLSNHTGWVSVEPSSVFKITCTLQRSSKILQQYSTLLSASIYIKALSRARCGVARMPVEHRRYSDEYVRHHVLDNIGDLYTSGYTILGSFRSYNTDHVLNRRFMHYLLARPNDWELSEGQFERYASENAYY